MVEDLRYTDLITDRTVDFIRENHHKPWLANTDFTTPHRPFARLTEDAQRAPRRRRVGW